MALKINTEKTNIVLGTPIVAGTIGKDGKSAYEVALANGFKGTEQEWLDSLVGPPGADGNVSFEELTEEQLEMITGPVGPVGPTGDSGVYVGAEEPTDPDALVWINPEGEASEALATKEYVDEAIQAAVEGIEPGTGGNVDLTNYYTKTEVDAKIPDVSGFATDDDVAQAVSGLASETFVTTKITEAQLGGGGTVDLTNYYTKSEVDTAIQNVELTPGPAGNDGAPGADGKTPLFYSGIATLSSSYTEPRAGSACCSFTDSYFSRTPEVGEVFYAHIHQGSAAEAKTWLGFFNVATDGSLKLSRWYDTNGATGPAGEPGAAFTYDMFTEEQLAALKGADGAPGANGQDYVLTDDDKTEIADAVLAALQNAEEVSV